MLQKDPKDRAQWDEIFAKIGEIAKQAKLRIREIARSL